MTHISRLDIDQFLLLKTYTLDLSSIERQSIIAHKRLHMGRELLRNHTDVASTYSSWTVSAKHDTSLCKCQNIESRIHGQGDLLQTARRQILRNRINDIDHCD